MFEKLVALLPYNPGLSHQLAFYSRRMREEAAIRRVGLGFLVLAFLVQFLAVMSPPQATADYSNNDMINGGISSQSDAVEHCKDNVKNYQDVLSDFGITCADVANASVVQTLSSTSHGDNLFSMGWLSYGQTNPNTGKATDQTPLNLAKVSETLYARHLSSFDSNDHSDYKALQVTSSATGKTYFILYTCGNLVAIGIPVPLPIPKPTPPPAPTPKPAPKCPQNSAILASSPLCKACPQDTNILKSDSKCVACPQDTSILASDKTCVACPNPNHSSILKSSPMCVPVCPYNSTLDKTNALCKPCQSASSVNDEIACPVFHKTAANITENISNADGTTAQPGDTIVYTLYAYNAGKATLKNYVFTEDLSDVMDYATPTNLGGGTINSTDEVTWPAVTIKPNATPTVQVTVKVNDPISQAPADPGDPAHFDLNMSNTFGNTINIKVPGSPPKAIETAAASLPNTGPGASLFIGGAVVMLAAYFYSRSRLLAKESMLAIQENAGA